MVPDQPTATNETLDVVLLLLVSLFLAQEMMVRLKRDMRIICIILFIFSFTSNEWWGWFFRILFFVKHSPESF